VDDQAAGVEIDDEVLGAPSYVVNALSGNGGGQAWINTPAQAGFTQHERGDLSPAHRAALPRRVVSTSGIRHPVGRLFFRQTRETDATAKRKGSVLLL
jgi:hypothetical protein